MSETVRVSKFLSYLLRHGAEKHKLHMSSDGFVQINEIIELSQSKSYNLDTKKIEQIVNQNDKKRFELKTDNDGNYLIRASQGHSLKNLDEAQLLKEITNPDDFRILVHGTFNENWKVIKNEGLKIMNRNHVHFAIGFPNDESVISGMRKSCQIFIEIDLKMAMEDGMKFFISSNKVVLSSGINGVISPKYFKTVKNQKYQVIQ